MVVQPLSACVGVLSLSLAVLDFARLHPYSFWAFTEPPTKTTLFVIDTDPKTWKRSLMIGVHSFVSIANHTFIFIALLLLTLVLNAVDVPEAVQSLPGHANPIGFGRLQPHQRTALFFGTVVGLFVVNVVLHVGMRSWRILPTSVVSMFVTIPWVAAKDVASKWGRSPRSNWPSWVLTAVYSLLLITLVPFAQFRTGKDFRTVELQKKCEAAQWSWEMTEVGGGLFGAAIWAPQPRPGIDNLQARNVAHRAFMRMTHLPYFVLYTFVVVEVTLFIVLSRMAMRLRAEGEAVPTKLPVVSYSGGVLTQRASSAEKGGCTAHSESSSVTVKAP
jgi:hypothetical protein